MEQKLTKKLTQLYSIAISLFTNIREYGDDTAFYAPYQNDTTKVWIFLSPLTPKHENSVKKDAII